MRKAFSKYGLQILLNVILVPLVMWGATKIQHAIILNSTIDSTTVGATTPSTGKFTTVTATGLTSGNCVQAGASGLLATTSAPCVVGTSTEYLNVTACTPATSTDADCPATLSITQPDSSYEVHIQMFSSAGAFLGAVVTNKSSSLISYNVFCSFNCSSYGTVSADVRVHHN